MAQCKSFLGGRQLVAPRRQLLILQLAPIGCQQMCLTRELILESIENCLLYACTVSLCTSLFVPRCRCFLFSLLVSHVPYAEKHVRDECILSPPYLVCLHLRQFCFLTNFPSLDCQKFYACFSSGSGMLLSPGLFSLKP